MNYNFFFRWYDLWVGAYIDPDNPAVYICLLPMIGIKISWIRYYEILSDYTGEVIGVTDHSAIEDVKAEEPKVSFRRISKSDYENFYKDD